MSGLNTYPTLGANYIIDDNITRELISQPEVFADALSNVASMAGDGDLRDMLGASIFSDFQKDLAQVFKSAYDALYLSDSLYAPGFAGYGAGALGRLSGMLQIEVRQASRVIATKNLSQRIALGKSIGLDAFANSQSAITLMRDPNFLNTVATELRNGTKFSVDLSAIGGDVNAAIMRAARGGGSPFDLELLEIRAFLKEGGNSKQIDFFTNGKKVTSPFGSK